VSLAIIEEQSGRLAEYARVPIGFTVTEILDDHGIDAMLHGREATPVPIHTPYWKDYDAYPGGRPADWSSRFDLSRWVILVAYRDARPVGGAAIIGHDPRIDLLRDCPACALLWDLRVAPDARCQGVGSALLRAAEAHARGLGARAVRVETQNVNVPACRAYQRNGYRLECVTHAAYAELPAEVQLIWRKSLG